MRDICRLVRELWAVSEQCRGSEDFDKHLLEIVLRYFHAQKGFIAGAGLCPELSSQQNTDSGLIEDMSRCARHVGGPNRVFLQRALVEGAALSSEMFNTCEIEQSPFTHKYLKPQGVTATALLCWPSFHTGLSFMVVWKTDGLIPGERAVELRFLARHMATIRPSSPYLAQESACGAILNLSPQQRRVVQLVADGGTNKEIACKLRISPNTVRNHLARIFQITKVDTRAELAAKARVCGHAGTLYRHEPHNAEQLWKTALSFESNDSVPPQDS